MGGRDRPKKETKKQKKDSKKAPQISVIAPQPTVEVIRKGKQREGREADED